MASVKVATLKNKVTRAKGAGQNADAKLQKRTVAANKAKSPKSRKPIQ
jgi:hypothetical protein